VPALQQQWLDFGETSANTVVEVNPPPGRAVNPVVSTAGTTAMDGVVVRRSLRARRYRLSVSRAGEAVLTIPARGSERRARQFLESQRDWLARTRSRLARLPRSAEIWTLGTRVLFRGEWCPIEPAPESTSQIVLGDTRFRVRSLQGDLRPALEAQFRRLARIELPARTWELAAVTGVQVGEVTIRNQRTRWGSCSSTGAISLNWRLVQAPSLVADYIVLHELMHRREMNHSEQFWVQVAAVCPQWREAEHWLKHHGGALGL
jgi:predicted metal-dependent hydrolase